VYSKDKDPPLILIDGHLPYPQAILQVFGDIKHCRRKNGRGRLKHPRLKPPSDLQVGVVKKLRDSRGNLLKVSSKALFGKKKQIEKRIQKLGIGQKSNTSLPVYVPCVRRPREKADSCGNYSYVVKVSYVKRGKKKRARRYSGLNYRGCFHR
jgi:hypothetical protein